MLQCNVPSPNSVSHVFPTSIAWYPGVGLAEAYLRKVPVAQRKTYLYHQEKVLDHPPPLAALNSSEVCSGSRSPFVAEEEMGSSLGVPTSGSQICGKWPSNLVNITHCVCWTLP